MNHNNLDIRWKQRFANLTKAKEILNTIKGVQTNEQNPVMLAGWIHVFDLVFELSWKTLRDYMTAQGESESLGFTRDILATAVAHQLISDGGYLWLDMLADRNSSTHEYDHQDAIEVFKKIRDIYLPEINKLYAKLDELT